MSNPRAARRRDLVVGPEADQLVLGEGLRRDPGPQGPAGGHQDDVVDAEFTEVKDDKK